MPVSSPGAPSACTHVLPGRPSESLQALATFRFRQQRYVAYISGAQLNILSAPNALVQAVSFTDRLHSVIAQKEEGRVVVSTGKDVFVLDPKVEGWTRVWWEKTLRLRREDASDTAHWLSLGGEDEVFVGGSHALSLFSSRLSSRENSPAGDPTQVRQVTERPALWSITVASPILFAESSPSATLIATCAAHGSFVKVWRRLSFEEGLFDYAYLPHPAIVTHIRWRHEEDNMESRRNSGMSWRHEENSEILYTVASDGILRVWRTGGLHDVTLLSLNVSIDLVHAIPSSPTLSVKGIAASRPPRYVFFISSDQLKSAVTASIGMPQDEKVSHSIEHLKEIASQSPDIVVALDGQGRMSAWGLQSIGHKRRPEEEHPAFPNPYHIAHAEDLPLTIHPESPAVFVPWFDDDRLHLLVHDVVQGANVTWWTANIETFLSPAAVGSERLSLQTTWCGHDTSVERLWHSQKLLTSEAAGDQMSWAIPPTKRIRRTKPSHLARPSDEHATATFKDIREVPIDFGRICRLHDMHVRLTEAGQIQQWRGSQSHEVDSDPTLTFETNTQKMSAFVVNAKSAVVVSADGREAVIIELADGYVEHRQTSDEVIRSLALSDPRAGDDVIAIAYSQTVNVLVRRRYAVHSAKQSSAWSVVKTLSFTGIGLNISALAWETPRSLAVAAGNAIFIASTDIIKKEAEGDVPGLLDAHDLRTDKIPLLLLSRNLTAPQPIWTPESLCALVLEGQLELLSKVFDQLTRSLKFWSSGEPLILPIDSEVHASNSDARRLALDDDTLNDLREQLDEKVLPQLTAEEQKHMVRVINAVAFLREHVSSLDLNAIRYLFSWRLALSDNKPQPSSTEQPTNDHAVPEVSWRSIAFAAHSATQQNLLNILMLHYDNKLTWLNARRLGLLAWLSDREALQQVFGQIAQSAYRRQQPPDPVDAALYYLALRKKPTLVGLWRIATWHREQKSTVTFLKRDFDAADSRTAARKNAYALMGKRRFEYSAAFFLLADDPLSAVNALAAQCEDVPLAVAVARVYSGDASDVLLQLVEERVMPVARQTGDRWMLSWCHTICGRKADACEALVAPLANVNHWSQDDPSTVLLYAQLRKEPSTHEYVAVVRSSRILRQMGLWSSALRLTASWKFATPVPVAKVNGDHASTVEVTNAQDTAVNGHSAKISQGPPSLLDSFSQLQVSDAPIVDEKAARAAKAAELLAKIKAKAKTATESPPAVKKPPPTQFKEPDANSLLDSFGF